MLTNCKNCGAPLKLEGCIARCEYCGSEFTDLSDVLMAETRAQLNAAKLAASQEAQIRKLIFALWLCNR